MMIGLGKLAAVAVTFMGLAVGSVSAYAADKDIVDTAVAAEQFKTLAAALTAGLVETLKGKGPFTVFAPTDAAFAKLPAGTVDTLLKPENKAKLTAILTYHVVPGRVMAADAAKLVQAEKARRFHLQRVLLVADIAQLDQILVPVQRIVIEVDLGIQRVHLAVLGENERIDLRE